MKRRRFALKKKVKNAKPAPKPSLHHRLVPLLPPCRPSHRPLFALRLISRRHAVSSSSVRRLPLPLSSPLLTFLLAAGEY
ncbi:hypothetical protein AHAS_Ahas13G0144600 [Arachis hypogaea]